MVGLPTELKPLLLQLSPMPKSAVTQLEAELDSLKFHGLKMERKRLSGLREEKTLTVRIVMGEIVALLKNN